jgi:hypothetical protein
VLVSAPAIDADPVGVVLSTPNVTEGAEALDNPKTFSADPPTVYSFTAPLAGFSATVEDSLAGHCCSVPDSVQGP